MIRPHRIERVATSRFPLTILTVFLFGVAVAYLTPGSASAGQYDVWSCRGPAGEILSSEAWTATTNDAAPGEVFMTDNCATGGPVGLHVSDAGVTGGRRARIDLTFDLPRGEIISGYQLNRAISAAGAVSGYYYEAGWREYVPGSFQDEGCGSVLSPPWFNCSNWGSHTNPGDPMNFVTRTGLSLTGLGTYAACRTNGCTPPFAPPAARFSLFSSMVTVVDNAPPALAGVSGSLTRPAPVSGIADLFVDATDDGAGVKTISLAVDGNPVPGATAAPSATCLEPYQVPEPCPGDLGRLLTVDTTALSAGAHDATGAITDAAGNSTPFGPIPFTVAEPDPGPGPDPNVPDNGTPAVSDPVLVLDETLVEHKPGETVSVPGRLTTAAGVPIDAAKLEVTATSLGGRDSIETQLPPVTTGADGRFAIPMDGLGARRLTVTYSPITNGAVARKAWATVRSSISLSFRAKPKRVRLRKPVVFSGKIIGGGASALGATTEIQAKSGGRWQTVANVSAKAGGKFRWKYRFRHVERNAIFSFRALVRANPGWPWPTVKSKKLKVRIRVPGT